MHGASRLAWLITYGKWPVNEIDHVDGNQQNNRIANLRDVPHRINMQNRKKATRHNKCGFLGVTAIGRKWAAKITAGGKLTYIGLYPTPELAHAAYLEAKRQLHAGCTI